MYLDKDPKSIRRMFDKIAPKYDFINNLISFSKHLKIKKEAIDLLNLKNEKELKVLDLCCGTGDLGRIVKEKFPKIQVYGVDFSTGMLKIASKQNKNREYYRADATKLPFGDSTFDCILMGFGLRNIQDETIALSEIFRVLKRNGQFLHLDFEPECKYASLYDKIIPHLVRVFVRDIRPYIYLLRTKNEFYSSNEMVEKFEDANFGFVRAKKFFFDSISCQVMKKY